MKYRLTNLLALLLLFGCQSKPDNLPILLRGEYPQDIGRLDTTHTILNDGFPTVDQPWQQIKGWYHSSRLENFTHQKRTFRKKLKASFNNKKYRDSGYLNLRFYITSDGLVGQMEVNTLDLDLEPASLDQQLVDHLVKFTSKREHWERDLEQFTPEISYMYIIYRIEHGKVTEIIP